MSDDRFVDRPLVEPLMTFKEYVLKVMNDPNRSDDLKDLIKAHGMPYLEDVIEGRKTSFFKEE